MLNRLHQWLAEPHIRTPLVIGSVTRLVIFMVAFMGIQLFGERRAVRYRYLGGKPHTVKLLRYFQRFDTFTFLHVARNGYQVRGPRTPKHLTNVTAFPLYPVLLKLLGGVFQDRTAAGVLVSLLCYFGVLLLLYRMVEREFDPPTATRAILYLSLFPTSWVYNAVYSEALFLLLGVLTLRQAAAGKPLQCGLLGMAASLTRFAGGLLALPTLFEFTFGGGTRINRKGLVRGLLPTFLITTGWLAYFSYASALTHNFWFYFSAHKGVHAFVEPWTSLWNLVAPGLFKSPTRLLSVAIIMVFMGLAVLAARRLRLSHSIYLATGILMHLCSPAVAAIPRYLMVLFPAYIMLAVWARTRVRQLLVVVSFCMLHSALLMAWLQWKYSF